MTDSNSLQDKVVLITGALTAVGRQLAHRLSGLGASLALVDSPSDGTGEQLSAILPTHTIYIQSDLRQQQDVRLMIEAAVLTFGHLDILVNNAHSLADETSDAEDVQRICDSIDVNFRAPVLASWVFSRYVRQAGKQGVVVNVTAMAGLVPGRGREVYGATNAGLIHFTEASRGRKNDVRVCALAPYYVDGLVDGGGGGRMLPGNKLGAALTMSCEQVVEAVVRCIFDDRLDGKTVLMAGGSTYTHTWAYLLARVHMFFIMLWSMLVLLFNRLVFLCRRNVESKRTETEVEAEADSKKDA